MRDEIWPKTTLLKNIFKYFFSIYYISVCVMVSALGLINLQ